MYAGDWKYLKGFRKYESPKHVVNMEKYLSKVASLHIKAIFVMTSALMLEADKKPTKKKSKSVFRDLDKTLAGFAKIVDRNFVKVNDLFDQTHVSSHTIFLF